MLYATLHAVATPPWGGLTPALDRGEDMTVCTSNCIEWIKIGISGLTPISIFIAFLAYRANLKKINEDRERERDKEYISQLQKSLDWSFNALTDNGQAIPPKADRLNWLTASRHIIRAKKIQSLITHPTYKTISEEIEEYWRHKFYIALSDASLRNRSYFMNKEQPEWPENIEITSALVIVDFSNWKDDMPDPTESVDPEQLINHGAGIKGMNVGYGLKRYIEHIKDVRATRANTRGAV